MSKKARFQYLLEKSVHSALSAIEIYNKPDFKYREEAFVILITNSWELLFKAKILKDNKNNPSSLYQIENTLRKDGKERKRLAYKKNRCGNYTTIDIFKTIEKINRQNSTDNVDRRLRDNIEILVEIRDNAIHFINESPLLCKKVQEIGTATLRSYLTMTKTWFDYDLSKYNFYLMPLSFFHSFELESYSINDEQNQLKNLLNYINHKEILAPSDENSNHNISLKLETRFVKSSSIEGLNVRYSDTADISVRVDAEQVFANKYPLEYEKELVPKLKERYNNFKQDKKFWDIKRSLEKDSLYCGERYLDMKQRTGAKKKYYSTEIFKEFDKHYTKKNTTLFD
jgi:hypothetical protein